MRILTSFPGGNAEVLSIKGDTVFLKPELRDTPHDWFYWCFAVVGAQGRTLTFCFDNNVRVGYYGAAVSHDLMTWHWQLTEDSNLPDLMGYIMDACEDAVAVSLETTYFGRPVVFSPERAVAFGACSIEALRTFLGE
ncbi:MAG: hypothetical protein E7618_01845 [Ruminococcaceae bacterium]|nr:hypothetical protein [Oscillospiraceae bacterium]